MTRIPLCRIDGPQGDGEVHLIIATDGSWTAEEYLYNDGAETQRTLSPIELRKTYGAYHYDRALKIVRHHNEAD